MQREKKMKIRDAVRTDISRISTIYSYYVENTAISFEVTAPTEKEMECRWAAISREFPYLVAEENGIVTGYAYAHHFLEREAYRRSVEVTIYMDRDMRGRGTGRMLYRELERRLAEKGVHNLYAIVMYPGEGSVEFHERMGYRIAGRLTDCGEKFGKLWSVVYMEKLI